MEIQNKTEIESLINSCGSTPVKVLLIALIGLTIAIGLYFMFNAIGVAISLVLGVLALVGAISI